MAAAAQNERLVAIDSLFPGSKVAASLVVVNFDRHIDVNAAQSVDHRFEPIEIDFGIMRDGNARKFGNGFHGKRRSAIRIRRIDLIDAIALDIDKRVALDRDERHFFLLRVDTREHHGIASVRIAELPARIAVVRFVGSHEQHVEGFGKRLVFELVEHFAIDIARKLAVEVIDVCESGTTANDKHRENRGRNAADYLAALLFGSNTRVFGLD